MARDPVWLPAMLSACSMEHKLIPVDLSALGERSMRRAYPVDRWISLYEEGCSLPRIAQQYHVGASTVRRSLVRRISLRDRVSAAIAASTKYAKRPFSGDQREGAFLAGLIEDFHVRKVGRLYEVTRAYRLVIYGQAALDLLRHLDLRHDEKVRKSSPMIVHAGERWTIVEPLRNELVNSVKIGVKGPTSSARLDYIAKHGVHHPDEYVGNERS